MFSGFQSNAFQNNAFQIVGSGSTPTPTIETHGGFDERDYHRYRKNLERVAKITGEERKYPKRAAEAAESLSELPINTTELQKLAGAPQITGTLSLTPKINYAILQKELELIAAYLDKMAAYKLSMEMDDEAAFLLCIQ